MADEPQKPARRNATTVCLAFVVLTTWGLLWWETHNSTKAFRARAPVMAPLVLIGITLALHRLFEASPHRWLKSAAAAGVLTLAIGIGFASIGPILDYFDRLTAP